MPHEEHKELLQALNRCAEECNHCFNACLEEEDIKMLTRCMQMDVDCAEICRLVAAFVSRGSEHDRLLLAQCAVICDNCAEECDKHSHMEHCTRCAEVCKACAQTCRDES